ncbi:MAG TPA: hypothetical protein VIM73_09915, partial [Polyangiaceae bacterium]
PAARQPAPLQSTVLLPKPALPAVPQAPALPSGLGPAVPAPVAQNFGAPIVPIPQRPISSSPPGPLPGDGAAANRPASEPPKRRFASTLVMDPSANPTPAEDTTPDPVLASAAKAWDDQIRAHEVPGFAVVRPRSEPPPGRASSAPPARPAVAPEQPKIPAAPAPPTFAPVERRPTSSNPPPPATIQRTTSRPPNQMKVTQPLGSFLPDGVWNEPSAGVARSRTPQKSEAPAIGPSTYSYVSNAPPAPNAAAAPSPAPSPNVVKVQPVVAGWRPDARLDPAAVRAACEPLYPLAVDRCFVLAVVSVPESAEAKSRVAAEIALALGGSGHPRVILVEGDLQRPNVQRMMRLEMPMRSGFSQQLRERSQVGRAAPWTVMGCSPTLHVLAEGMMRSPGLLLSQYFSDCIADFRKYYDFVVIDGPLASLEMDSKALDAVVNGVLTVCPAKGSPSLSSVQSLFSQRHYHAVFPTP